MAIILGQLRNAPFPINSKLFEKLMESRFVEKANDVRGLFSPDNQSNPTLVETDDSVRNLVGPGMVHVFLLEIQYPDHQQHRLLSGLEAFAGNPNASAHKHQ